MTDLNDHDAAAIRSIGLGPDNAGPTVAKHIVPDGWLPYESVPKDGNPIWVCGDGRRQICHLQTAWSWKRFCIERSWIIIFGLDGDEPISKITHWAQIPAPVTETN